MPVNLTVCPGPSCATAMVVTRQVAGRNRTGTERGAFLQLPDVLVRAARAGEIGAGGLARNVPPVIGKTGSAIVYGHGVFSIGRADFREAFQALVDVENRCRAEYFRLLDEKIPALTEVSN